MLKKAASGVLALLPCSRNASTLRAPKGLRPCWTDFFDHSLPSRMRVYRRQFMSDRNEMFNSPINGTWPIRRTCATVQSYFFLCRPRTDSHNHERCPKRDRLKNITKIVIIQLDTPMRDIESEQIGIECAMDKIPVTKA